MKKHYYHDDIVEICNCKHLTVDEIFEELIKIHPEAWRSSIYRNVEELAEKWLLKKISWVDKKSYFEKNIGNHIHLIDRKTLQIVDAPFDFEIPWIPDDFKVEFVDVNVFWEFTK